MTTLAKIRPATPGDTSGMAELLNEIIAIGGTTAIETPVSPAMMEDWYLGDGAICCHVALDSNGAIAGFQAIEATDAPGIGASSTFARQTDKVAGVGTALFEATKAVTRAHGLTAIDAKIRADNAPGLAYYKKMGFQDHHVVPGVPLANGTPVDRVVKRYQLA
ncbi:MAG: GNAT family N-acetyltransferase [Silicimonas sp.]|nr:GNAT family N-acetyltransferase [Silicimonas sp.]